MSTSIEGVISGQQPGESGNHSQPRYDEVVMMAPPISALAIITTRTLSVASGNAIRQA